MTGQSSLSSDLLFLKEKVYDPCGFEWTNFQQYAESREYDACSFELDGTKIQYRASKITPTKSGQFVTIWKRNVSGITVPFDVQDDFDFIVIIVKSEPNLGQFIFPKAVLLQKGIISRNGKGGKRGIRVYAPWDTVTSKQAQVTQHWQSRYFMTLNEWSSIRFNEVKSRLNKMIVGGDA